MERVERKQKRLEKTSCGSLFPITIKNKRSKRVQFIYHLLPQPYFTRRRDSFRKQQQRFCRCAIFSVLWKYAVELVSDLALTLSLSLSLTL